MAIIAIVTKLSAGSVTAGMESAFKQMSGTRMNARSSVNVSQAGKWTSLPDHVRVRTKLINAETLAVATPRVNATVTRMVW